MTDNHYALTYVEISEVIGALDIAVGVYAAIGDPIMERHYIDLRTRMIERKPIVGVYAAPPAHLERGWQPN